MDVTQENLALLSGVSSVTISKLERGIVKPRWETAVKLATALDVQPLALFPSIGGDAT